MTRLHRIAALVSVTLIAACGQEPAAPVAPPLDAAAAAAAGDQVVDPPSDDDLVGRLFAATAGDAADALPAQLTSGTSKMRVAVVALHDHLLERRTPLPGRAALLAAMEDLAAIPGGVDGDALAANVRVWKRWTDAECVVEAEWARSLTLATAALSLSTPPGVSGLQEIASRARLAGAAPERSPAAAGIAFVEYAALALGEPGSDVSGAQREALETALEAFVALDWPGGFAAQAEPLAVQLLEADPTGVRGNIPWATAADAYRRSGDMVRAGLMYVDRARHTWYGQADPAAADRALRFAAAALRWLEEPGDAGLSVAEARMVVAAASQAVGRHAEAVEAAAAVVASPAPVAEHVRARMELLQAVSLLRLGRLDGAADAARAAGRRLDAAEPLDDPQERRVVASMAAEADEVAATALLDLGRHAEAAAAYESAAARHARRVLEGAGAAVDRDAALLLRARALARGGDSAGARGVVQAVLASAAQPPSLLALSADVLLDAGLVDDAENILDRTREALGPERAVALGEIAARIAVARGDLAGARLGFQAAIDHLTGGDGQPHGLPAARILRRWAEAERDHGEPERAALLVEQALAHLTGSGLTAEIEALRALARSLAE